MSIAEPWLNIEIIVKNGQMYSLTKVYLDYKYDPCFQLTTVNQGLSKPTLSTHSVRLYIHFCTAAISNMQGNNTLLIYRKIL